MVCTIVQFMHRRNYGTSLYCINDYQYNICRVNTAVRNSNRKYKWTASKNTWGYLTPGNRSIIRIPVIIKDEFPYFVSFCYLSSKAAQAYDIRALQFGRTDHLNYNTRGGHAQFQQDHSRLLSKRVLGASVIELDVAQQRLVRIIVKLARGSNNVKSDSANAESEICVDAEREDLIREAEDLVKAADDAHNRVHTCLEMLLLV